MFLKKIIAVLMKLLSRDFGFSYFFAPPFILICLDTSYGTFFSIIILFTAVEFAPGGSSPTLVQTKTMKQHYTIITTQYIKT
jgi:hypothetical protein